MIKLLVLLLLSFQPPRAKVTSWTWNRPDTLKYESSFNIKYNRDHVIVSTDRFYEKFHTLSIKGNPKNIYILASCSFVNYSIQIRDYGHKKTILVIPTKMPQFKDRPVYGICLFMDIEN